jgi:hypothetical protein
VQCQRYDATQTIFIKSQITNYKSCDLPRRDSDAASTTTPTQGTSNIVLRVSLTADA